MTESFQRGGTTYYLTDVEYDAIVASDAAPLEVNCRGLTFDRYGGERSQAFAWLADVYGSTPQTNTRAGDHVAKVFASICGDDSQVTITHRDLSELVGGQRVFAEDGVKFLKKHGWLRVETSGKGRGAVTTYYLLPGDLLSADEVAAAA